MGTISLAELKEDVLKSWSEQRILEGVAQLQDLGAELTKVNSTIEACLRDKDTLEKLKFATASDPSMFVATNMEAQYINKVLADSRTQQVELGWKMGQLRLAVARWRRFNKWGGEEVNVQP